MESLALLVVVIFLSVIFFAGFTGFLVGDLVDSVSLAVVLGVLPGIGVAVLTQLYPLVMLWLITYFLGFQLGRFLR